MRRWLFLGSLALLAVVVWLAAPVPQGALAGPEGDAAAGKAFYAAATCKSCHGNNGEGKYGPPLAGTTLSASAVISEVRNNSAKHVIYRTEQISDTALSDMTDYLQTLTKPVTFTAFVYQPKPGDDPGKVLFNQKMCAACHGENGDRIFVQSVRATNRTTITQDDVEKQLRNPRRAMPAQSEQLVSKADVAVLAPFIKAAVESGLLTPPPSGSPAAQGTAAPTAPAAAATATRPAPTVAAAATPTSAPVAAVVPTTAPAPASPPAQTAADNSSTLLIIAIAVLIVLALIGGYFYMRRSPR